MKPWCVTIQMKAIEQYFHVVLFIMLYKVGLINSILTHFLLTGSRTRITNLFIFYTYSLTLHRLLH